MTDKDIVDVDVRLTDSAFHGALFRLLQMA